MRACLVLAAGLVSTVAALADPALIASLDAQGVHVKQFFDEATLASLDTPSHDHCSQLCEKLPAIFPGKVLSKDTPAYTVWDASFWSQQQAQVQPACIFQPANSSEVSAGLLLARLTQCPFAVKSGGHAAFAGGSNIQNGLTIDLSALKSISISPDRKTAQIGAGNVWLDVYSALQPYNLSVIGGRVADIGVGGLTLGGGISFFSQRYGWACDNVNNYEVVLADGRIVDVNYTSYPDLYWALRGGGNNFGIVTRFDLATHSQGVMWGGSRIYTTDYQADLISGFVEYAQRASQDPDAALILNFAYAQGAFLAVANIEYARPVIKPPIFDGFETIPAIVDTMGIKSLPDIALEFKQSNPDGLRESFWTATFKLDADLVTYIVDLFETEIEPIKNATGLLPALVLQIITTDMLSQMEKNGGNALGLSPSAGNLLLMNLAFMWANEADDAAIMHVLGAITSKSIAEAKSRGLYHEFLYMNYASQYQNVVPSYGAQNHQRLQAISKKYDPDQVFQTLQPGYFKLNGPPNSTYP
ncbi:FAD binding domain protein [Rasamsonia emersonii CBS 393.64]|uniref:FAD binding domain protein n=1 Tax=Rasamsonia emersonii (strain ATCC 16479 / CBS 393.64 / IMI 116815) TaxID=1408163 RepID=A0A0F4YW89_RASE3|nr:FAD binding domain protein [Rasamsonia emersonii CBS 393.64]KKA22494.1 FAD binding domain protein [Rasamsonia emersonii CBS 393.64]